MTTRRTVIAGGLAAATLAAGARAKTTAYPWPLALQLWSVGAELDRDLPGTLGKLVALGYRHAETAGWHGLTPAAFAKAASSAGLACDSAHVSMGALMKDATGAVGEARDAGCKWLVCSAPQPSTPLKPGLDWLTAIAEAMSADDWHRNAEIAARTAEAAAAAGIGFAWHNHVAEFVAKEGVRGIEVLMKAVAPARMAIELDIAWATAGGEDAAHFIADHADRVRLIHVKDVRREANGRTLPAVVGAGTIDWPPVFAAARKAGVRHAFIEIEAPHLKPVMEELASARDYVRKL